MCDNGGGIKLAYNGFGIIVCYGPEGHTNYDHKTITFRCFKAPKGDGCIKLYFYMGIRPYIICKFYASILRHVFRLP